MIEKEMQFVFFLDLYLFELEFLFKRFPNDLRLQRVSDFLISIIYELSRVRWERNKEAWFLVNFFHFKIFETFGNLLIVSGKLWSCSFFYVDSLVEKSNYRITFVLAVVSPSILYLPILLYGKIRTIVRISGSAIIFILCIKQQFKGKFI